MFRFVTTFVAGVLCIMLGMGARDAGNTGAQLALWGVALGIGAYMLVGGSARNE